MWLQLGTPHAERRVEFHHPHRWIRSKDHLNVVIEIHGEINLTGVAVRPIVHIAKIGMPFCCASARWTEQIPRHIENASPRGSQTHLQHRTSVNFPMVSQSVRPNTLDR